MQLLKWQEGLSKFTAQGFDKNTDSSFDSQVEV